MNRRRFLQLLGVGVVLRELPASEPVNTYSIEPSDAVGERVYRQRYSTLANVDAALAANGVTVERFDAVIADSTEFWLQYLRADDADQERFRLMGARAAEVFKGIAERERAT